MVFFLNLLTNVHKTTPFLMKFIAIGTSRELKGKASCVSSGKWSNDDVLVILRSGQYKRHCYKLEDLAKNIVYHVQKYSTFPADPDTGARFPLGLYSDILEKALERVHGFEEWMKKILEKTPEDKWDLMTGFNYRLRPHGKNQDVSLPSIRPPPRSTLDDTQAPYTVRPASYVPPKTIIVPDFMASDSKKSSFRAVYRGSPKKRSRERAKRRSRKRTSRGRMKQ